MAILVQKYGGSSVADVEKIGLVADRVVAAAREGHRVVVVVSAMGKTTDSLLELARTAARGGNTNSEPQRRELDMLVSTGERVTMALLSIAIHARGYDAISFTGSQSGILTSDRHFDARILEVRPHRIERELERGRIVIVAGYQGMSYGREITTLGRGGSDTTAVALAAALGAERCEIYSDVDGVYSADPRVVSGAQHLPEMNLAMLGEMAEAGAKVLNAQAVEWARRHGVVIHARKTADIPGTERETVAQNDDEILRAQTPQKFVRAIVGLSNVMVARVPASNLAATLSTMSRAEITLGDVVTSGSDATVHIPLLNVPDWSSRAVALERDLAGYGVVFLGAHAVVSVVGYGLTGESGAVGRALDCLEKLELTPVCVSGGPLRISATLPMANLNDAQQALHACFVA